MKKITGYRKEIGMLAWYLHMLSGAALILFIFLNIYLVSLLSCGEKTFNTIMKLMHSPFVLILEMVLLCATLYHVLNGIRILFFDMGLWIEDQKDIAYTVMVFVAILFLLHFIPIFEQFIGSILL